MGVSLSIKDVPEALAERLRRRAEANHRSLQGELMAIIERAAAEPQPLESRLPGVLRSWTQGTKTVEQWAAERDAAGLRPHPSLASAPLGVDIVRADRDAR